MNAHKRAEKLVDRAKALGLVNPVTNTGAPTEAMIAEAIVDGGDYAAEASELAVYVRRLVRIVRRTDPENAVAAKAVEYLRAIGELNPMR